MVIKQPEDIKKDFPSLYRYVEWLSCEEKDGTSDAWFVWYPMVKRYAIDKAIVRDAIESIRSWEDDRNINELLRRLGLEGDE